MIKRLAVVLNRIRFGLVGYKKIQYSLVSCSLIAFKCASFLHILLMKKYRPTAICHTL
jgi:hypothetical protein